MYIFPNFTHCRYVCYAQSSHRDKLQIGHVLTYALTTSMWHVYANWMMEHHETLEQMKFLSYWQRRSGASFKHESRFASNLRTETHYFLIAFAYIVLSVDRASRHPSYAQKCSIIDNIWLCSTIFNQADSTLLVIHACVALWVQSKDCPNQHYAHNVANDIHYTYGNI